jgi:peptidoglycan/LPS O-acetylase OafA/YrhL
MVAAHFWSLSMEEQFYMVWPCLIALMGIRKIRWFAAAGALACASYRFIRWDHYDRQWFSFQTEARADALLAGCLLALLFGNPKFRAAIRRWSLIYTVPAVAILFFCIPHFHWLPPLYENLSIAALIGASVVHPQGLLARVVSTSALAWLGTISYSLYIWQQFFMGFRGWTEIVFLFVGLPLFALGSYYCIELPCVRLGHRLTRSRISLIPCEHTVA